MPFRALNGRQRRPERRCQKRPNPTLRDRHAPQHPPNDRLTEKHEANPTFGNVNQCIQSSLAGTQRARLCFPQFAREQQGLRFTWIQEHESAKRPIKCSAAPADSCSTKTETDIYPSFEDARCWAASMSIENTTTRMHRWYVQWYVMVASLSGND